MQISENAWQAYVRNLSKVDARAAELMEEWIARNGTDDLQALIDYAYAVSTRYGEGAAALACEMYDSIAKASGVEVPPAVPAETVSYGEVTAAAKRIIDIDQTPDQMPKAVERFTKRAAADTTLKNAERDGAQFAWVPHGDTCAFCIVLASRGWQYMSSKALKNGHAEHIHNNCDCEYAVRFNDNTSVKGYDPDKYLQQYESAEGSTPQERINSMRRAQYAADPEKYREQKREAYERARRINYGSKSDIETDRGVIGAHRIDKYGYNRIYVDENVTLTERQLRGINKQISEAKQLLEDFYQCDAKIVVADMDDPIATYNPRTNTMLVSKRMISDEEIRHAQKMFACPEDSRSTAVHELFHWKDAYEYRQNIGEIIEASELSPYSIYQREKAFKELKAAGIDLANYSELRSISEYALNSALDNNWEEVYTEYRTKKLLLGGV